MEQKEVIKFLEQNGRIKNVLSMARFGIRPQTKVYGVSVTTLRQLAKTIGKDTKLAKQLYKSGIHECRLLASIIVDAQEMDSKEMDRWAEGFDSWDICDMSCMNVFRYHPLAIKKCFLWSEGKDEYYKRAGFALMAALASDKKNKVSNAEFEMFLPLLIKNANDNRNYVKKAVNWALRQIGKRNEALRRESIKVAETIIKLNTPSARFIGGNALRELKSKGETKKIK